MTQEEIIEGNKLIAEFMGGVAHTNEGWLIPDVPGLPKNKQLQYHTSFDWLMPVRRKLQEIFLYMATNGHDKLWLEMTSKIDTAILTEETPAKAARLISHTIKWYNDTTKPETNGK